jgi:hypothetical protein
MRLSGTRLTTRSGRARDRLMDRGLFCQGENSAEVETSNSKI